MYQDTIQWLLDGDLSVKYLTMRDLLDANKDELHQVRIFSELEGWVKQLLNLQDECGTWSNSYDKQRWTATIWVINQLRKIGLSPDNIKGKLAASLLLENGAKSDGSICFDECKCSISISALVLANVSYFKVRDPRREAGFEFLIEKQLDDGGWNDNQSVNEASFHTTLTVLDALNVYSKTDRTNLSYIQDLQYLAHELLLSNHLINPKILIEDIDHRIKSLIFPNRNYYNLIAVLDYFQEINYPYDSRIEPAIQILKKRMTENKWPLDDIYKGDEFFLMEYPGQPSRWITLKALRVLKWWERVSKYKF